MTSVTMLQSISGSACYGLDDFSFRAGQVVEVDPTLAALWVGSGIASYSVASGTYSEVTGELPQATADALVYTLQHAPSPSSSLKLYVAGLRQTAPDDFVLSGTRITFTQAPVGNIQADYRY